MDRKLFGIGVLTITAAVLFIAQFIPMRVAQARDAIKDRDYTLVTSRIQTGGEGLYIVENRTGMMAVFTWDAASRTIKLRAARPIADAFAQ